MTNCICVVGYGRIGSITAQLLRAKGIPLRVFDKDPNVIKKARSNGLPVYSDLSECVCPIAAVAVPSRAALDVVEFLASKGISVVDVSYIEDPLVYSDLVNQYDVTIYADTGLAPGLSNAIAAYLYSLLGGADSIVIYVGGLSYKPYGILGLVASWSIEDLIEEYTRPARARIRGRNILLDPLDHAFVVGLEGVGVFEALPTDGLRTMLTSFPDVDTMVEYTLRYPGHLAVLKILRDLGLFSDNKIDECPLPPKSLVSMLLEKRLPRSDDRVVLYVVVEYRGKTISMYLDIRQDKLNLKYPALSYITALVHAWFTIKALTSKLRGLVLPEYIGLKEHLFRDLLSWLKANGVNLEKRWH